MNKNNLSLKIEDDLFEINIKCNREEYNNLKKILVKLANDKGQLLITD